MSLANASPGRRVLIVGVDMENTMKGRLAAMGLIPGAHVEVIKISSGGSTIVAIKGSRIALAQEMAQRVFVA